MICFQSIIISPKSEVHSKFVWTDDRVGSRDICICYELGKWRLKNWGVVLAPTFNYIHCTNVEYYGSYIVKTLSIRLSSPNPILYSQIPQYNHHVPPITSLIWIPTPFPLQVGAVISFNTIGAKSSMENFILSNLNINLIQVRSNYKNI